MLREVTADLGTKLIREAVGFLLKYSGSGPGPDGKTAWIAPVHPAFIHPAAFEFLINLGEQGVILDSGKPGKMKGNKPRPVWRMGLLEQMTPLGQKLLKEKRLCEVPDYSRCRIYLIDRDLLERFAEWLAAGNFGRITAQDLGGNKLKLIYAPTEEDTQPDFMANIHA